LQKLNKDAFNLTNSCLYRFQKNAAEIPISNVHQLNHSSYQPSGLDEKIRKQSSALTAAFKDTPETQFGRNIHEDYA
jgi:hypothetical protein